MSGLTPAFLRASPWHGGAMRRAVTLADEAGARIVWDRTRSGWDVFAATLAAAGDGPAILLADDITLTTGWRPKIEAAITARPGMVQQFFSLRDPALRSGRGLQPGRTFLMTRCFYLPPGTPGRLGAFLDSPAAAGMPRAHYDAGVAAWLRAEGRLYWLHVPSLVQVRPGGSEDARSSPARLSPTFVP